MDRLIYTAMTGASATLNRQAAVSHNLANVSTTGYKAEEHRFRAAQIKSNSNPAALPTRAFAVDASTHTDYSAGPMIETGRALDVAVQSKGWITLSTPDGNEAYTRAGSLEINANGVLQTRSGIPVLGDGGIITIPAGANITIGKDGTVSLVNESGSKSVVNAIGRIKLVNPPEDNLVRGADGLFRAKDGLVQNTDDKVVLYSGFIENSNVNPVEQMVSMISLSRQFEMQMKALTTADQDDRAATQVINAR